MIPGCYIFTDLLKVVKPYLLKYWKIKLLLFERAFSVEESLNWFLFKNENGGFKSALKWKLNSIFILWNKKLHFSRTNCLFWLLITHKPILSSLVSKLIDERKRKKFLKKTPNPLLGIFILFLLIFNTLIFRQAVTLIKQGFFEDKP